MRLILHTAAYWLMLTVRDAIPKAHALATAEFTTIRLRLFKLGARVIELASRVRLAFAAACPVAIRTEKHPKSAVVIWVVADDEVFVRSWRGAKRAFGTGTSRRAGPPRLSLPAGGWRC
jgi:hypothetical protein